MKTAVLTTAVRSAVFLFCLGSVAYAQNNPYMPYSGSNPAPSHMPDPTPNYTPDPQSPIMQGMLPGPDGTMTPLPDVPQSLPNSEFQELRSQQEDNTDALAREKIDREAEIKTLKDAIDAQLREMQKKLDAQQSEIDAMHYPEHH